MSTNRRTFCALALAALIGVAGPKARAEHFDVLIRGGEVMDGIAPEPRKADVGIRGDRIAALGDLADDSAERIVEAEGLLVVPGFIDLHSHADGGGESGGLRSRNPKRRAALNLVAQGVTTAVVNQDGRSLIDLERQRRQLEERAFGLNAILMVGHNTIRRTAMTGIDKRRPATEAEIDAMRRLVLEGMAAGAFGLSAGLEYEPGIWSTTDELVALVKEIAPFSGVYIVHERASGVDPMWYLPSQGPVEPPTMFDSLREVIAVAEATGATSVATHIKARGVDFWGSAQAMVEIIEEARGRGVPIYADQYPYESSGSDGTIVLIPYWIFEHFRGAATNYRGALSAILRNSDLAERMHRDVDHMIRRRGGADRIYVLDHPVRQYVGKTLAEIAEFNDATPRNMVYLLQVQGYRDRFGGALLRGLSMAQEDIDVFAAQPWVATASDAGIALPEDGPIHPRYYGTFPRKLAHFVRDRELLDFPQALRSMTSLPAEILGLRDRGVLREGSIADLVVLDLDALEDTATYFNPHQYPKGIPFVLVNGIPVIDDGEPTYALPGRVLQRPDAPSAHTDD